MNDCIVTFTIPLMARSVAQDWARIVHQLEATLGSIYGQTDPHFRIILVGTDRPELSIPTDDRFEFIATHQDKPMSRLSGVVDGGRKRHRAARRLGELGGGYLMSADADDLVNNRLVEFIRADRNRNGYLVRDGYMLDAGRGLLSTFPFPDSSPAVRFDQECGTSVIGFFSPAELPASEGDWSNRYGRLMAMGHPGVMQNAIAEGRPFKDLPFRAACYVRNTGENISAEGAATNELHRIKFQAYLDDQVARHALRRTPELDRDFNLAAAEAAAKTPPAARRYRPAHGLSVLISTYRRAQGLRRLLTALRPQVEGALNREIIVVNDGSHDAAYAGVAAEFADVITYHALPANQGIAMARNACLERAAGTYAVFTDDDCEPPPWWLDWLAARLRLHPEADVVVGRTTPRFVRRNFRERIQGAWFLPQPGQIARRLTFVTANAAIRVGLLRKLGGFGFGVGKDGRFTEFVGAGEDTEASLRLHRAGARFLFDPGWSVAHDVDQPFRSLAAKYRRYGAANATISQLAGVEIPVLGRDPDGGPLPGFVGLMRAQLPLAAKLDEAWPTRIAAAAVAAWIYSGFTAGYMTARQDLREGFKHGGRRQAAAIG